MLNAGVLYKSRLSTHSDQNRLIVIGIKHHRSFMGIPIGIAVLYKWWNCGVPKETHELGINEFNRRYEPTNQSTHGLYTAHLGITQRNSTGTT